ncbi:MAG: hypothetical protein SFY92_02690 [Verrucomicrobiae bacterium]|nr:hypothetical protein [Verrucomicrobiae bacterium]
MTTPLQFYRLFRDLLREQGVRALLTSGMACVEYGIQETTKDTDWIIHPDDFEKLVSLLCRQEKGLSGANWRISYRGIFGAPLDREYHLGGWTSHLIIQDVPSSEEQRLDFFGQPPRLTAEKAFAVSGDELADELVVAQMKKTDRDKDWPMVEALCDLVGSRKNAEALLHARSPDLLKALWTTASEDQRKTLMKRRPLLVEMDTPRFGLRKCLAAERTLWEEVNKGRYRRFQHEWKQFIRRWRGQNDFAWPVSASFDRQHDLVCGAVRQHELPLEPLGGAEGRMKIVENAQSVIVEIYGDDVGLLETITPPLEEMLP